MLYLTFLDLVPESIEKIGLSSTMLWFFIGVAAFGFLELIVLPGDHDHDHDHISISVEAESEISEAESPPRRAGLRKRSVKKSTSTKSNNYKTKSSSEKELKRTGLVTFLALFMHNIPEGLGVYLATLANEKLGLELAVAIMLHNIVFLFLSNCFVARGNGCCTPIMVINQIIFICTLNDFSQWSR
jgi:ZIP family zinc transporter